MKKILSLGIAFLLMFTFISGAYIFSSADAAACTVKIDRASYIDKPDALTLNTSDINYDGVNGYRYSGSTQVSGGYLTYKLPYTKEILIKGALNGATGAKLSFEISNDGVSFTNLDVTATVQGSPIRDSFYGCDYYGESTTEFRYIKISFPPASWCPTLSNVYVNPVSTLPITYETTLQPDAAGVEIDSASGELKVHPSESALHVIHNSSGVSTPGTVTFKSDTYPITDYNFRTLTNTGTFGGTITFSASKDGQTFTSITPTKHFLQAHPNGGWGAAYYYNYGELDPAQGYYYIRAELNGNGATGVIPALDYAQFNVELPEMAASYANRVTPNQNYEVDSTGTLKGNVAEINNLYLFHDSENKIVDGTITFKTNYPITDYNFRSVIRNNNLNGYLTFSASSDGTTFTAISPIIKSDGIHNATWDTKYYCNYGAFAPEEEIYYLRVEFHTTANTLNKVPTLQYFEYNLSYPSKATSYAVKMTPTQGEAASASGISLAPLPSGVNSSYFSFTNDSDKKTNVGSVTFYSKYPITSYNIATIVSKETSPWGGNISFSASSDGESFETIEPIKLKDSDHGNGSFNAGYFSNYESFDAGDNIHYIRVNIHGNNSITYLPGFAYVEINQNIPVKPASYANTLIPTQGEADSASGISLAPLPSTVNSSYYTFANDSGSNTNEGSVTFYSKYPITDYNIRTIMSKLSSPWGGGISFSASSDGEAFETIEPIKLKDSDHSNVNFNAGYFSNYESFDPSDNIHYIRVNIHGNSSTTYLPGFQDVQFNVKNPSLPTEWSVKTSMNAGTATSDDGTLKAHTEAGGYYVFWDENEKTVNGKSVFYSETAITAYNIKTIISNVNYGGVMKLAVSSDGENYTEITPFKLLEKAHPNESWNASYFDNYGFFEESDNIHYLRVEMTGTTQMKIVPAAGAVWYNCVGITPVPDPTYDTLSESTPLEDLDLSEKATDFTANSTASVFKRTNFNYTSNGTNAEYIGGANGLVSIANQSDLILYTPNIRDFKLTAVYTAGNFDTTEIKAYYWTSQYGAETEIPLIRYLDPDSQPTGFKRHIFRPANRAALPNNIQYIVIRLRAKSTTMTQLQNFTFFYDGPAPGAVPKDSQSTVNPNGTDRTDVKTYNFIKNNMQYERIENMIITSNAESNVDYIGTAKGITTNSSDSECFIVFRTDGLTKFYLKVNIAKSLVDNLDLSILLAREDNDNLYTEVPLEYIYCDEQPTGWAAIEFIVKDGFEIPEGNNFLKVLVKNGGRNYQITRLDYEYKIPDADPLPGYKAPDTAKGEKSFEDKLESSKLLEAEGGKMSELFQIDWSMKNIGENKENDKVLIKDNAIAESYVVYNLNDISHIDIRGYRYKDAEEDLLVYVSADGEDWELIEDFERFDSQLFGGPMQYAHIISLESIPGGMNYVKIEIPELIEAGDLVISDVYLLYNLPRHGYSPGPGSNKPDVINPDTGDFTRLVPILSLFAAVSLAALLIKKREMQ